MLTREDRERELVALLRTYHGQDQIISLYQKRVARPDKEQRPAMHPGEMIPRILDAEFPERSGIGQDG